MNDKKFIVYLKNGQFYPFNCAHYIYRIDTERKLIYVTYFNNSVLKGEDVLVVNLKEFSHIELVNF